MTLRYYREENRRHSMANKTHMTRQQMVELSDILCNYFGVPCLPVYFSDRLNVSMTAKLDPPGVSPRGRMGSGDKSLFHPASHKNPLATAHIRYGVRMFNALTVAHEVAHYLHDLEHKNLVSSIAARNLDRVLRARENPDNAAEAWASMEPTPTFEAHGRAHREWVDKCVACLVQLGYVQPQTPIPASATNEVRIAAKTNP